MAKIKALKQAAVSSNSRDLISLGSRQISSKSLTKRNENGDKPTTARALILRDGKYGARGTGELMLVNKMTGWEKLELLADDLVVKSKKAVLGPFRLDECLKIAESQYHAYLDEIAHLQDPSLFYSVIEAEYQARQPQTAGVSDQRRNASYMASVIATTVHNTYVLASAWSIVLDTLRELDEAGLSDSTAKIQLRNEELRSRYLILYDMVNVLANMSQAKFSVLATTTPHFGRYFKRSESSDPTDPEFVFDWSSLREAGESFLDSIIIELCFPCAPYPRHVLYQILHEAVEESPRETARFPQALWDAVGDLAVTVELQDMLERPLIGNAWKEAPRGMPERYERWIDAQIYSEKASEKYANFKDIVHPLEMSKKKHVLDNMWKYINLNYKEVSGMDIDTLWQLDRQKDRTPQWHAFYIPNLHADSDDDDLLLESPAVPKKKKKPLAITDGTVSDEDESGGSMPGLQSVSNSSEEESASDSDSESGGEGSDESGYNTEEEDELRNLLREAMDIAHETALLDSSTSPGPEVDNYAEERKSNPFLKLLSSLRGRMFSANPKLRTAEIAEPRPQAVAVPAQPDGAPKGVPAGQTDGDKKSQPVQSHKTTVEEVEDKDAAPKPKKKKKKPKKKKKLAIAAQDATEVGSPPPSSPTISKSPTTTQPPMPTSTPAPKTQATNVPPLPSSRSTLQTSTSSMNASTTTLAHTSTTSLSLPIEQTTAQSARSYIQSEKLETPKSKVKSRPEQTPLEPIPEKKGLFSKFTKTKEKGKESEADQKRGKHSWFSRMTKKTKRYMHQLLKSSEDETQGLAPMKWEHFMKVMREMGFGHDPSTAGSSVRFDPPDKRDKPITFHKPHPDSTLSPVMIKRFGKRLKEYYGWSEEDFIKHAR